MAEKLADVSFVRNGKNFFLKVDSPGIIPISNYELDTHSHDGRINYSITIDGASYEAIFKISTCE